MSGGLSTPGQVLGEGPDVYKCPFTGTQETLGGAGAKRSPPDITYTYNRQNIKNPALE